RALAVRDREAQDKIAARRRLHSRDRLIGIADRGWRPARALHCPRKRRESATASGGTRLPVERNHLARRNTGRCDDKSDRPLRRADGSSGIEHSRAAGLRRAETFRELQITAARWHV